jgi:hypothetical protein
MPIENRHMTGYLILISFCFIKSGRYRLQFTSSFQIFFFGHFKELLYFLCLASGLLQVHYENTLL